jgi:hypothetical protein
MLLQLLIYLVMFLYLYVSYHAIHKSYPSLRVLGDRSPSPPGFDLRSLLLRCCDHPALRFVFTFFLALELASLASSSLGYWGLGGKRESDRA